MTMMTPTVLSEETSWRAIQEHDAGFDGQFVYGVRTTGIYCRPSCPARRPQRKNIEIFPDPSAAEEKGYRPCQRCHPHLSQPPEPQQDLIVRVCRYLDEPRDKLPTLGELAQHFSISPFHLQRTFKRLVGVSPRQYADAQRQARLKAELQQGERILDAAYGAGYGSTSTFYEQSARSLGMSPVTYRRGGEGMAIRYAIVPCRLGQLLVAATERGVCKISLGDTEADLRADLEGEFPQAERQSGVEALQDHIAAILAFLDGTRTRLDLPLDIQATVFQRRVWEALRQIPYGATRSYGEIAEIIGEPGAARAVAQACARNPVALAIPCHRVTQAGGNLSGYRWGVPRKRALLEREASV